MTCNNYEKEKVLRAYADAIDVEMLKREQTRIASETTQAEKELAGEGLHLEEARALILTARRLELRGGYEKAYPEGSEAVESR